MKNKLFEDDPRWEYFTVLEPDNYVSYNNYFYKKTKCHRIEIDDPKAKVMAGYKLIEKDLRNCQIWLRHIKELLEKDPKNKKAKGHKKNIENREQYNLIKGLFVASLTIYGKCFTQCEGRKVKLERKNLEEKYHEDHDEAMSFRHNFAAHGGAKK